MGECVTRSRAGYVCEQVVSFVRECCRIFYINQDQMPSATLGPDALAHVGPPAARIALLLPALPRPGKSPQPQRPLPASFHSWSPGRVVCVSN